MLLRCARALVGALVMFGASAAAARAAPPLEAYGKLPAIENVDVSPDGETLAYLKSEGDARQLVVQKLDGTIVAASNIGMMKVRSLSWASNDHVLVSATTTSALPDYLIRYEFGVGYSFNIRTGKTARLLDRGSQEAFNALLSTPKRAAYQGKPVVYVAGWTLEQGGRKDIYRIDLDSGYATLVQIGSVELLDFVLNDDGSFAAKTSRNRAGRWRMEMATASGWREIDHRDPNVIETPDLLGFGRRTDSILVMTRAGDQGGWELTELARKDGAAAAPIDLNGRPDIYYQGLDGRLLGVAYTSTYPDYHFYEPALADAWAMVRKAFPGRAVSIQGWSDDYGKVVIRVEGTGDAGSWYLIDTRAKRATRVGAEHPGISPGDVAEVRTVHYKAADGLAIDGYLTLPPGREPKNLPLVVLAHGGPASRDTAGFDWIAQALASRGYAVLQANFRGSTGKGEAFLEAGYGEWGRKMQTDLSDGVAHLAAQGLVDPNRACIVGGSYGGYAALAGAALQPGVYRCAVSIAGVSDLPKMLTYAAASSGSSKSPESRYWLRYMGVQAASDPKLEPISPARAAANVRGPVLLIHGRDDTVVPYEQSALMERALKAAGKNVSLVTLRSEDHWLSREATRLQTLQAAVAFLEKENPPN